MFDSQECAVSAAAVFVEQWPGGHQQSRARRQCTPARKVGSVGVDGMVSAALGGPADRVILRGLRFFGRHGVLAAERALGQRFVVDMDVGTCLRAAGVSDDLCDTVNYAALRDIARDVVSHGPPRNLLETLAEDIAARILKEHPPVAHVRVAITKPHVAIPDVDALGVEILRTRDDLR